MADTPPKGHEEPQGSKWPSPGPEEEPWEEAAKEGGPGCGLLVAIGLMIALGVVTASQALGQFASGSQSPGVCTNQSSLSTPLPVVGSVLGDVVELVLPGSKSASTCVSTLTGDPASGTDPVEVSPKAGWSPGAGSEQSVVEINDAAAAGLATGQGDGGDGNPMSPEAQPQTAPPTPHAPTEAPAPAPAPPPPPPDPTPVCDPAHDPSCGGSPEPPPHSPPDLVCPPPPGEYYYCP